MSRTYRTCKGNHYEDKDSKNRKAARSCLNHGGCDYCKGNRLHKHRRQVAMLVSQPDEVNG